MEVDTDRPNQRNRSDCKSLKAGENYEESDRAERPTASCWEAEVLPLNHTRFVV